MQSESITESAESERKQRSSSSAIADEASREHFDIATIIVTISDINDHAPEFRPGTCYPLAVPENNNSTVIHTIVATDLDEAANGEIIYNIIGGNAGNKFSIDSKSGELTARSLDREQQSRYLLQIQVQDRGAPISHEGHCNISIIVEDINDNTPYFVQNSYAASVAEDVAIGTSVMRIQATDVDLGINSRLTYTLSNETTNLFAIDKSTGIIRTMGFLDREKEASYSFQIVATDGGRYQSRSARVPVKIVVDDVNDNKPVFEQYPYRAQVPALVQPGQALLQVTAKDIDFGLNGEVYYSLDNRHKNNSKDSFLSKKLKIDTATGVISASQSLASAANRLLHIEVLAYDKGNPAQSTVGIIELFIGERNMESPSLHFQNETYRIKLREHAEAGTRLVRLNTFVSDGRRQDPTYSFITGNEDGIFALNSASGEISVKDSSKLGYERFMSTENSQHDVDAADGEILPKSRSMFLMVMAQTNLGQDQAMYAYAKIIVDVEDINDSSPQFTQQEYVAAVWEGNHKGTFVLQINATDADAANTPNSNILYHIVDGNHENAFAIDQTSSGIVKTNIVLDREIRDMYKLKVIATDKGNPQRTGSAVIRIHVIDINDNQPTFPPHSVVNINEATELGTVITTVSANDIDTYPSISYRLHNKRENGKKPLFAIDTYSGKVVLINFLDYEKEKQHEIEIIASDTVHEVRTILTVHVIDTNDNPPIFQVGYPHAYFALLSQPAANTPSNNANFEILVLNATDADGAQNNSIIHYAIEPPVVGFEVDELTGSLKVNMTSFKNNVTNSRNFFYLLVVARDGGSPPLRSSVIVQVQLKNNQVYNTQLLQTQYRVQINEDAPLGTVLLKLNNEIIDLKSKISRDNQLKFSIVGGNEDGYFEILASSAIVLIKPLDRELNDIYKLRVAIYDVHSSPQQQHYLTDNSTAAINVIVNVEDANDNAPIFQRNIKYAAELSETAPLRFSIAKLTALDADQLNTPNSEVVYDITSGNDERMFAIDLLSGVLFVNHHLDYDTGSNSYALTIRACDSGNLPRCSLQLFNITLLDENDNGPQFPVHEQIEYVGENEAVGTRIFSAHATDLDRGIFGQVNYTLVHKTAGLEEEISKLFHIDNHTGTVSTSTVFDFESRENYDLTILSMDKGGRSATLQVRVKIESRDEYTPQFTESIYHFVLPLLSNGYVPLGYALGQVRAIDRDKGPDGRVVYQIRPQHKNFKINRTSGTITLKRKIEYMTTDERDLNFIIIASSGQQNSLESKAVVEITLDPLLNIGMNLPSSDDSYGPITNWALGSILLLLFVACATAGIIFFTRMRKRKPQTTTKPHLNSETLGTLNSYISSNTMETLSGRPGGSSNSTAAISHNSETNGEGNTDSNRFSSITVAGQISPPKYDEIPPYASHSSCSNSGPVTTSELSGSEQSGSSGRGSAEDDGEDEEVCMINEGGPMHRCNAGSAAGGNSAISIEGRISDISVQNTQEYLARLGIVDRNSNDMACSSSHQCAESVTGSNKISHNHHTLPAMHMFDDPNTESDITNLIYAKLSNVGGAASEHSNSTGDAALTVGSIEVALDHVMSYGDIPTSNGNVGPSMSGSLSSIIHSEEELTGSYNWDYLLDWGPQYQPLAHVFSEIARLKDDSLPEHCATSGKFRQPHCTTKPSIPPPLLTNVTPCAVNIPVLSTSNKMNLRYPPNKVHYHSAAVANAGLQYMLPRSPINHDTPGDFTCSAAMSPSFSPSLSPLATRSPSISPLGIPGGQRKKNVV